MYFFVPFEIRSLHDILSYCNNLLFHVSSVFRLLTVSSVFISCTFLIIFLLYPPLLFDVTFLFIFALYQTLFSHATS